MIIKLLAKIGVDLTGWRSARYERRVAKGAPKTYSQYGEDACLRGFMDRRCRDHEYHGFWVDIGAHHPTRFSNTRMFSEMGWRGINVNVGVGAVPGELDYYQFPDHAYNTFVKARVDELAREWGHDLVDGRDYHVCKVPVVTLKELLDVYLPSGQKIDFLSVDAEGLDFEILKSNDWEKYRPDYVLAEVEGALSDAGVIEMVRFLRAVGYELVGRCFVTAIFKRS